MRILVIRLSAIGDVVMASGLIPALRARYPEARIAWLAEPAGAGLLAANPRLDEVIVLPRPRWKALRRERRYTTVAGEMRRFAAMLRGQSFDLALDAQGLLKSALWARASGAARRISLGGREGSARLMTEVVPVDRSDPRIASEYRRLAEHLGAPPDSFAMNLAITEADRRAVDDALAGREAAAGYAVLCPFTTRPQKHWFDDRWRELGQRLGERAGLAPVILGGPADRDHAEALVQRIGGLATSLAGALSVRESAAAIAGARLLVGVDTGLTHMGTAFGIPTVALFGSTRPYLETDSPRTRVLYEPLWCSPCGRNPICGGKYSCMRLHHTAGVLETALALVEAA